MPLMSRTARRRGLCKRSDAYFEHLEKQRQKQQLGLFFSSCRSSAGRWTTMSASRLPLKGGFASMRLYLSRSGFWSLRLSRYSMKGLPMPWVIMFMARCAAWCGPCRSHGTYGSCSGPSFAVEENLLLRRSFRYSPAETRKPAVPQAGSQITSSALGSVSSDHHADDMTWRAELAVHARQSRSWTGDTRRCRRGRRCCGAAPSVRYISSIAVTIFSSMSGVGIFEDSVAHVLGVGAVLIGVQPLDKGKPAPGPLEYICPAGRKRDHLSCSPATVRLPICTRRRILS